MANGKAVFAIRENSELTDWNCRGLNSRCGWDKRCHFHLEHLGGNSTVKLLLVFIVMFKELTWNIVIVLVNVVRFDFSFLLGWTVISLMTKENVSVKEKI